MDRPRVVLQRRLYRLAYGPLALFRALFPQVGSPGVKCVLTYGGEVLLVRHNYGPRSTWRLPGGGVRRGESALEAARREMQEELGVEALRWQALPAVDARLQRMRPRVSCLHGELPSSAFRTDPVEIAEAGWFSEGALPARLAKDSRLVLNLLAADRAWAET